MDLLSIIRTRAFEESWMADVYFCVRNNLYFLKENHLKNASSESTEST